MLEPIDCGLRILGLLTYEHPSDGSIRRVFLRNLKESGLRTSPLHTRKEAVQKDQLPLSSGFYTQPVPRAAAGEPVLMVSNVKSRFPF
jgi:hypothetical protein